MLPADQPETVRRWCAAFESSDATGLADLLAPDVVLHSPLTNAFTFDGRDAVLEVFTAAVTLVGQVRFPSVLSDGDRTWALVADGVVDGSAMQEVQLVVLDERELVCDVTLFGRPLPSLTAVMRDIAPPLLAHQGRPRLGRATRVGNAPLAAVTRLVERHVMPRLAPSDRR